MTSRCRFWRGRVAFDRFAPYLIVLVGLSASACVTDDPDVSREPSTSGGAADSGTNQYESDGGARVSDGSTLPRSMEGGAPAVPDSGADGALDSGEGGAAAALDSGLADANTSDASGSAANGKPPFVPTGAPLMAPDKTWTWFEFPNTTCRNGGKAGINVSMSAASKKVMIFMEAGGACFDFVTCLVSPDVPSAEPPPAAGIFDRENAENPVKDWNFVYVPYCTGDVHLGSNDASMVEGVDGPQHFVGRLNLVAFMNRVVPTFSDAEQVLVTGTSAGGFAASASAELIQWTFGGKPRVAMIDDSGPPMSNKYLPKCLIDIWTKTWSLDKGIGAECGDECTVGGDFEMEVLAHVKKSAAIDFGVLEAESDAIIRGFYGIGTNNGANDCMGTLLLTPVDETVFRNGLLDFRERVRDDPRFSSYYPPGSQHTWLQDDSFYSAPAAGVRIVDWFKNILDGKPGMHVGP
jgi:hypothetical protein